ncbi:MAG: COX15/CtaA family protein [Thermoanaerobaculia bacterium]
MTARAISSLSRFSWAVVAINLAVILWGAIVRATGSGAGCGSHWPLCNGEVVPTEAHRATLIEFGHRVTSGLALVAVVVLAWFVFRKLRDRNVRETLDRSLSGLAWLALLFMFGEAAIGAGIVLLRLVGDDASLARAGWMAFHLLNTFLLLGTLALIAERASLAVPGGIAKRQPIPRGQWLGFVALFATGASGAVAALGDTLFPAASLAAGVAHDFSPGASFLVRLRTLHPLVAVLAGLLWLHLAQEARRRARDRRIRAAANGVTLLVFVQLGAGLANLALLAPVPLQLLHLLLADLLWIAAVILADRARTTVVALRQPGDQGIGSPVSPVVETVNRRTSE